MHARCKIHKAWHFSGIHNRCIKASAAFHSFDVGTRDPPMSGGVRLRLDQLVAGATLGVLLAAQSAQQVRHETHRCRCIATASMVAGWPLIETI